jgi:hypothetical protein
MHPQMFVYVVLGYYEWQEELKRTGRLASCLLGDECGPAMKEWLVGQMRRRLPAGTVLPGAPVYAFRSKPPAHHRYPPKRAVCKVRVDDALVVPFDDEAYLDALNCINNGFHSSSCSLSYSRRCADASDVKNRGAPSECTQCTEIHERMFEVAGGREEMRRAFIPSLTRAMVTKVWIYRNDKRLSSSSSSSSCSGR